MSPLNRCPWTAALNKSHCIANTALRNMVDRLYMHMYDLEGKGGEVVATS